MNILYVACAVIELAIVPPRTEPLQTRCTAPLTAAQVADYMTANAQTAFILHIAEQP